jgi:hypothetical protein
MSLIGVEILPEDNHQIDIFADIGSGLYSVPAGTVDSVPHQLPNLLIAGRCALRGEEFFQMHQHPIFELPYFHLRKYRELLSANDQHWFEEINLALRSIAERSPERNPIAPPQQFARTL